MKVIVLAGLLSVEKIELVRDLVAHFASEQQVMVIDNIARIAIENLDESVSLKRVEGNVIPQLADIFQKIAADVTILALSEQTHPEKLFIALDDLREIQSEWEIYSLALIDTRTCDCFPNVRKALEMYADVSVMIPYNLDEIVNYVDSA